MSATGFQRARRLAALRADIALMEGKSGAGVATRIEELKAVPESVLREMVEALQMPVEKVELAEAPDEAPDEDDGDDGDDTEEVKVGKPRKSRRTK